MTSYRDACPDCNARARLIEVKPKVYVLAIEHDATCPLLRAKART